MLYIGQKSTLAQGPLKRHIRCEFLILKNPPQINPGSGRRLRSNDCIYLHPSCLLGFFFAFGSASVDGLDEEVAWARREDADACLAVMSAAALSIACCEFSSSATSSVSFCCSQTWHRSGHTGFVPLFLSFLGIRNGVIHSKPQ